MLIKKYKRLRKNERNALMLTTEGTLAAIALNLTNPFYSMFARRMGAGDYQIGLISSLPSLVVLFTLIPASLFVNKCVDKKKIVASFIGISAILFAIVSLTPLAGSLKVTVFIISISILNFPYSLYMISWQSFFSDVFSFGNTNVPYAVRLKVSTFFGVVTLLLAGLVLSYIPKSDIGRIHTYQIFYILAFLLTLIQMKMLLNVKDYQLPTCSIPVKPIDALKSAMKGLRNNKGFSTFIILAFFFHVTFHMAWPLFFIYQVDYLFINEAWMSYLNVAYGLASTLMFGYWSKMIDKKGPVLVLVIGAIGMALNPVLMIMTNNLMVTLGIYIALGLMSPAFLLGLFQSMLLVVPEENKTLNIAIYTTVINVSGFLSPIMGVAIYKMTSIYFTMTLSSGLRFIAALFFYISYKYSLPKKPDVKIDTSGKINNEVI